MSLARFPRPLTPMLIARLAPLALLVAPALAQAPGVRVLLRVGDPLPGGGTVTAILDQSATESGLWVALVDSTAGRVLIRNQAELLREGDPYLGDTVATIHGAAIDSGRKVSIHYAVDDPARPSGLRDRIAVDDRVVLSAGDELSVPGIGATGPIDTILDYDHEESELLVSLRFDGTVPSTARALVQGTLSSAGDFTPASGFLPGLAVPGLSATLETVDGELDVDRTARSVAAVLVHTGAATPARALVADGAGLGIDGGASTGFGAVWSFGETPRIRTNRFGTVAVAASVRLFTGAVVGRVYVDGSAAVYEGSTTTPSGDTVAPFTSLPIELDDDGDVLAAVPYTSGAERLLYGGAVLVETGVTRVPVGQGDALVTGLYAGAGRDTLACSRRGLVALTQAELDGVTPALLAIERDFTLTVACSQSPNSTGQVGLMGAVGSRSVVANVLTLTARNLPPNQFGIPIVARTSSFVANPGGSDGNLCLGGTIGRFNGLVRSSGAAGTFAFPVDLTRFPQGAGFAAVAPGESWVFQCWHRQTTAGAPSSCFTQAVRIFFVD